MQEAAGIRGGQHRDRVVLAESTQVGAFERIDSDVDRRIPVAVGRRRALADLFADVEHRRFVAFALANHDRAVDGQLVHRLPHGFDGGLVGLVTVALPHREGRGDRGLLDNVQEMKGKVGVHG